MLYYMYNQGIIDWKETFAKTVQVSKIIEGPKVDVGAALYKFLLVFLTICSVLGALLQHVDGWCLFMHYNIYSLLLDKYTLKSCHWVAMSVFHFGKGRLCFRLFSFLIALVLWMHLHQLGAERPMQNTHTNH